MNWLNALLGALLGIWIGLLFIHGMESWAARRRRREAQVDHQQWLAGNGELEQTLAAMNQELEQVRRALGDWPPGTAAKAAAKALALVEHVLPPPVYHELLGSGFVDIASRRWPTLAYRLNGLAPSGFAIVNRGPIPTRFQDVAEPHVVGNICIDVIPSDHLPREDRFLTLYLLARYQEGRLLQTGNVAWRFGGPPFVDSSGFADNPTWRRRNV